MPKILTAQIEGIEIPGLPEPLPPYTIDVHTYKRLHKMQQAITKATDGNPDMSGTGAAFTPNGAGNHIGTLWLARENLDIENVMHECVHAGVRIAQVYCTEPDLTLEADSEDGVREELIAYTASKLAVVIIKELSVTA